MSLTNLQSLCWGTDDLHVKNHTIDCAIQKTEIHRQRTDLPTVRFLTGTSIAKDHDDRFTSNRAFINTPRITLDISTEYGDPNTLRKVSCLNDDKIWRSDYDRIMRLFIYNLKGDLLKAIQTISR